MSLFALNSDPSMLNYGIIYTVLSSMIIPVYSIVLTISFIRWKKRANISFTLMVMINILEGGQGFGHVISGPIMIFPEFQVKFKVVIRVIGSMMDVFWISVLPTMSTLAVSRVLIFNNYIPINSTPIALKVALCVILSYISVTFVVGSVTQNFAFYSPSWYYDFSAPYSLLISTVSMYLSYVSLIISLVAYFVISILIYKRRQSSKSVVSHRKELAILIQYTATTLYMAMIMSLFRFEKYFSGELLTKVMTCVHCLWILHCYVNPLLLVSLNRSFRNDCKSLLGLNKLKTTSVGTTSGRH